MKTKKFLFAVMLGVTGVITGLEIALATSPTGNRYRNHRRSDVIAILVAYLS